MDGLLTLDLPPEEASEHLSACEKHSLKTVFIVAPNTPEERLDVICRAATGFVYYVSREGVTGERDSMAGDIATRVAEIKEHTVLPVVVGFGISTPEHVKAVAGVADGVVVGSAIVNCIARHPEDTSKGIIALRKKVAGLAETRFLSGTV